MGQSLSPCVQGVETECSNNEVPAKKADRPTCGSDRPLVCRIIWKSAVLIGVIVLDHGAVITAAVDADGVQHDAQMLGLEPAEFIPHAGEHAAAVSTGPNDRHY